MTAPAHPRVAEVARLLAEAGGTGEVRMLPAEVRTAAAAAAALGVPVGAIANSLVFDVGGCPAAGPHQRRAPGRRDARSPPCSASPGIAPRHAPSSSAGTPARPSAASPRSATPSRSARSSTSSSPATSTVWAAAGHPATVFPTTYDELLRLTAGTAAEVGHGPADRRAPTPPRRSRPMTGTKPTTRVTELPIAVAARPHARGADHLRPGHGLRLRRRRRPLRLRHPAHRPARLPRRRRLRRDPGRRAARRLRLRLPGRARASGGTTRSAPPSTGGRRRRWLPGAFEVCELHVHPDHQSQGLGRRLLHALVADLPHPAALLSTPDADTKAFRLYHADGFVDLARGYHFPGDARPFAILGARLPLHPRDPRPGERLSVTGPDPPPTPTSTSSSSAPGHNGLVAACYLARAGLSVEVVESDDVLGGAVSTVERWPGVRVDRGSSAHVIIRQSGIVEELDLAAARPALRRLRPVGLRARARPRRPRARRPAAGLLRRPRRDLRLDRRRLRPGGRRRLPPVRRGVGAAQPRRRRLLRPPPEPGRADPVVLAAGRPVGRAAPHPRRRPRRRLPRLRRRAAGPLVRQRAAQGGAGLVRRPVRPADVRARAPPPWSAGWRCCTTSRPATRSAARAGSPRRCGAGWRPTAAGSCSATAPRGCSSRRRHGRGDRRRDRRPDDGSRAGAVVAACHVAGDPGARRRRRPARPGRRRPAARQRLRPGRPGAHRRPAGLSRASPADAVATGTAAAVHRPRRARRRARRLGAPAGCRARRSRWRCASRRATTPSPRPGSTSSRSGGSGTRTRSPTAPTGTPSPRREAQPARRRRRPVRARASPPRYSGCTSRRRWRWSANCRCPVATSCTWRWAWPACSPSGPRPRCPATRVPGLPGLYLAGASTHPGGGVSGNSGRTAARVLLADRRPARPRPRRPAAAARAARRAGCRRDGRRRRGPGAPHRARGAAAGCSPSLLVLTAIAYPLTSGAGRDAVSWTIVVLGAGAVGRRTPALSRGARTGLGAAAAGGGHGRGVRGRRAGHRLPVRQLHLQRRPRPDAARRAVPRAAGLADDGLAQLGARRPARPTGARRPGAPSGSPWPRRSSPPGTSSSTRRWCRPATGRGRTRSPGLPGIDTVPLTNLAGWLLAGAVLMTLLDLLVARTSVAGRAADRRRGAAARARLDDPRRRARPRRLARAARLGGLGCGAGRPGAASRCSCSTGGGRARR